MVKIAGLKTSNDDGFFFPEAVVCSFMFAGNTHVDVTNNSYFADPFRFNCHNDPTQQAIWKAECRAIRYAITTRTPRSPTPRANRHAMRGVGFGRPPRP